MFKLIIAILIIVSVLYFGNIIHRIRFFKWYMNNKELHDYNQDKIRDILNQLANSFDYSGSKIPYGRAKWFVEGEKDFIKTYGDDELEFFGYSPVRSKIEEEFLEYGLLLTQNGIYYKEQIDTQNKDKNNRHISISKYFPFDGLWRIDISQSEINFYYPHRIEKIPFQFKNSQQINLMVNLNDLINTGYTADLYGHYIEKKVNQTFHKQFKITPFEDGVNFGSIVGMNLNLGQHLRDIQFNPIANARMAHGYAAEYSNDINDKIKYPFKDVQQIGQNNQKNGADRIVGIQKIQTKYHSKARSTVNSAFEPKEKGGTYRYPNMQLEVPKEQYNESIQIMKEKIRDGKVPGHHNPEDAYKIIRKGNVTYNEAKLIAKGGNVTSLKYDALDGAIQSLPAAGISFVIVFAGAKWSGSTTKEAATLAIRAGLKTMTVGTIIYATSQQIGKIATVYIANITGKKVAANLVAQRFAGIISFGIVIGPDLFDALRGRISSQQLLKNTLIAGGGIAGGIAGGAIAGATFGPVGTIVGAVAGGTLATIGSKSILDNFFEDDRVEMFAILKEEFIDVVMSMSITDEEFELIQDSVFDKKLNEKLKDMFQKNQSKNNRTYTREKVIEKEIERIIAERTKVTEYDILEAVEIAEKEFAVL